MKQPGLRRGQIDQNNDELIEGNETSGGRWGQKIQSEEIDVFEGNQIRGQNADGKECDEDPLTHEYNLSPVLYGNDIESSRGYQGGSNGEKTESGGGGGRGNGQGGNGGKGNAAGGGSNGALDEAEIQALHMALDDEYHALATYLSVIETFGEVEPFVSISQSEQRHIEALVNQFTKSGIAVPQNPWLSEIPPFESLNQACQTGVEAEIADADLYTRLFSMTDNPALIRVFTNLSRASLESHLPQFESCS